MKLKSKKYFKNRLASPLPLEEEREKHPLSTTQVIAAGFLSAIAVGTLLLSLPIASASGEATPLIDALFSATTSVCVTGLVTVDTFSHWSVFGQIVILLLIQLGGLGVVTFTTSIMVLIGRRVSLKDRLLLEEAFNLNSLSGLVEFMLRMLKYIFAVEFLGFLGYCAVFVPQFGTKGIWYSLFNAVSAFCNAGMDIIGPNSLMDYSGHFWVNFVTSALIVIGGLGIIVLWDIRRVGQSIKAGDIHPRRFWGALTLHSKIVLTATPILILSGALLVFALEYSNPETLGNMPLGEKILASFFQSITLRTAGFSTIPQKALREPTALICMLLMFVGGSPVGTAGGVKTTTIVLALLSAFTYAKGRDEIEIFGRAIPNSTIRKALGVTVIAFIAAITGTVLLSSFSDIGLIDSAYEVVSALATVGLSRNVTGSLNVFGKLLISLCMYLGRIGPISLVIMFNFRKREEGITLPDEDVTVG